jgi:phosphate/phosphite/phosphonate ABC transporter binding protein
MKKTTLLLFVFILFIPLLANASATQKTIRFGFIPGKSPHLLVKKWNFVIRHLNRETELPVEFIVKENYADAIEAFEKGELDLLEGGAFVQSLLMKKNLSIPVVAERRMGRKTYRSAIYVRKNSGIETLKDLNHKIFAFTDPLSTSGYVLPRITFDEKGIKDLNTFFSKIYFSGSQDKSIRMLLNNQVDAISIGDMYGDFLPVNIKKNIHAIEYSDSYPLGHISAHKDLSPLLINKIKQALLNLHKITPFETLKQAEFDNFEPIDHILLNKLVPLPDKYTQFSKLTIQPAPKKTPLLFSEKTQQFKKTILIAIAIPTLIVLFILIGLMLIQKKGSLRKYFAVSISIPISILAILLAGIQISIIITHLNSSLKSNQQSLEAFHTTLESFIDNNQVPTEFLVQKLISENELIEALRVFKENIYVLDSTKRSLGKNIVDNVLVSTFTLAPQNDNNYYSEIIDSVWSHNRIWGNAQVLFTFEPLKHYINRMALIHSIILLSTFFLGFFLYILLTRKLQKPMDQIALTLNKLKTREAFLDNNQDTQTSTLLENFSELANEFSHISEDIVEQNTFLELKQKQLSYAHTEQNKSESLLDPELEQKIKNEIIELESKHENFHDLRQTELIGSSPEFLKTLMDAIIRAKDNDPVLIYGPTGSGKTGVAKSIHMLSIRRDKLFGEFNCVEFASADPLVVLGKLFGYGKNCGIQGIPKEGQPGLLEKYDGGTLFLDEVELIPHQAQRLLLLPLEGRPYNPAAGVGNAKKVNVRFVFATNTPLQNEIKEGVMRADFYRRINARGTIMLSSLKERKQDVALLMKHFLKQWNRANNQNLTIHEDTKNYLASLNYESFNVSELKTTITIAADRATFSEDQEITEKHLSQAPRRREPQERVSKSRLFDALEEKELMALCKTSFNIALAENELGYSSKAKTLSNHFRGICYKLLASTFNKKQEITSSDYTHLAIQLLGNNNDQNLTQKVANKMQRFYEKTQSDHADKQQKLFNNLPKKYHESLSQLINSL